MSKLDDIFDKYKLFVRPDISRPPSEAIKDTYSKSEAKQQIKDLMLELIGEDQPEPLGDFSAAGRNSLRYQLRQKVNEL